MCVVGLAGCDHRFKVDHAAIVSLRINKADKDYDAKKVAEISKPADVYDDNGRKVIAVVMAGVR